MKDSRNQAGTSEIDLVEVGSTHRPRLIPALILGLPLGLLLLGSGSLWFWYQNRNQPKELDRRTQQLGLVMRRDITKESIERTLLDYTQVIGERSTERPKGLEVAASYADSTLGFMSLGFQTHRISWPQSDSVWHHVIASLHGKSVSKNLWLMASYDAAHGEGTSLSAASAPAAIINLAGALNGRKFDESIHFALVNFARPESYAVLGSPGSKEFLRYGALIDHPPRMILWVDQLTGTGRLRLRVSDAHRELAQALASLFRREGLEAQVEELDLPESHAAVSIQRSGLPIVILDTIQQDQSEEAITFDEAGMTSQVEALARVLRSILGERASS